MHIYKIKFDVRSQVPGTKSYRINVHSGWIRRTVSIEDENLYEVVSMGDEYGLTEDPAVADNGTVAFHLHPEDLAAGDHIRVLKLKAYDGDDYVPVTAAEQAGELRPKFDQESDEKKEEEKEKEKEQRDEKGKKEEKAEEDDDSPLIGGVKLSTLQKGEAFAVLTSYAHTGSIKVDDVGQLLDVVELAAKIDMPGVVPACNKRLWDMLTVETTCQVLARLYDRRRAKLLSSTYEVAMNFASKNIQSFVRCKDILRKYCTVSNDFFFGDPALDISQDILACGIGKYQPLDPQMFVDFADPVCERIREVVPLEVN